MYLITITITYNHKNQGLQITFQLLKNCNCLHVITITDYNYNRSGLEYKIVTQPELARMIANHYKGRLAILYDRILRHRKISKDKSNTLWNINLNVPARSMKGFLMLFEDVAAQQPFAHNT